jgi:hypothetical protein
MYRVARRSVRLRRLKVATKKAAVQEADTRTKVYYSGEWATRGIQEARICIGESHEQRFLYVEVDNHPVYGPIRRTVTLGVNCFYDRRDAVLDARRRQRNRLLAMQKTMDRIESLTFEEVPGGE